jgi:hypothetical protein
VTVPTSRLPALLASLDRRRVPSVALRMLDGGTEVQDQTDQGHAIVRWVLELPKVRDSAQRLQGDDGGSQVLLPIVILEERH